MVGVKNQIGKTQCISVFVPFLKCRPFTKQKQKVVRILGLSTSLETRSFEPLSFGEFREEKKKKV